MSPPHVDRSEDPRPESRLLSAAIDEALALDEVTQAAKRGKTDTNKIAATLSERRQELLLPVKQELVDYIELAGQKAYIAKTIRAVVDPWKRPSVRRPYDPISRLLQPIWSKLVISLPERLLFWLESGGRVSLILCWSAIILYWLVLAAAFLVPVGLYPFGLVSGLYLLPGVLLLFVSVATLVWGLSVRLLMNRSRPPTPTFEQRLALASRLDAIVEEDPDYRAVSFRLDELGRRIQRKLLEQSVLPAIRTLLNTTLRGDSTDPKEFLIVSAPGLGEVDDHRFEINTASMSRLTRLLRQLPGGSVGLSGPRGVGKTTILRAITTHESVAVWPDRTLRVYLPAPVHYVAVEFISYLASELCNAIVSPASKAAIRQKVGMEDPIVDRARSLGAILRGVLSSSWPWRTVGLLLLVALYVSLANGVGAVLPTGSLRQWAPWIALTAMAVLGLVVALARSRGRSDYVAMVVQLWLHYSAVAVCATGAAYFATGPMLWALRHPIVIWGSAGITVALAVALLVVRVRRERGRSLTPRRSEKAEVVVEEFGTASTPPVALQAEAESLLEALAYTQSKMSGTGSKLSTGTSAGIELKGELSQSHQITVAQHDLTMPELVARLRRLIESATSYGRVLVAIDELDKIDSEVDARRFINDVKAIFGVYKSYFVVAVSQDAMVRFERRGLAIRTEIDSAFDEVIYASYLTLDETRALLERRVIGLSAPYVQLCYCLSGGLPRDAIRSMRNIVNAGLAADGRIWIAQVARNVLVDEMARYATATLSRSDAGDQTWPPEVFRALSAVRSKSVHPAKYHGLAKTVATEPGSDSGESAELAKLRWELQVVLRFYGELFRFFSGGSVAGESSETRLERLAQARRDLAQNLSFAAQSIDGTVPALRNAEVPADGRRQINLPSVIP